MSQAAASPQISSFPTPGVVNVVFLLKRPLDLRTLKRARHRRAEVPDNKAVR